MRRQPYDSCASLECQPAPPPTGGRLGGGLVRYRPCCVLRLNPTPTLPCPGEGVRAVPADQSAKPDGERRGSSGFGTSTLLVHSFAPVRWVRALAFALVVAAAPCGAALAVEPDEMLDDPVLEQRARVVSEDLRCVVCQNESIDESNAEMARDMRILVRDRILMGESNDEVKQYLVDRYGDYVLLDPPFKPTTYVLWFGPAVILLIAVWAAIGFARRKGREPATPDPLDAAEQAHLSALLNDRSDDGREGRA